MTSLGGDVALVPAPPSKAPSDPEYDDRNVRVCQRLVDAYGFTLCRDVEMAGSVTPSHLGGSRDPRVLAARMVRQGTEANAARIVFVLDDLLTVGAHFAAVKSVLVSTGCTARICGLFLARAVYEDEA